MPRLGSPRPDARAGRARLLLSRLPALALLLGAFGLFAAAPAAAQDPTPPSVPQNVAVVAGDQSATLTWDPPASWGDGHSPVYLIDSKLSSAMSLASYVGAGPGGVEYQQQHTVTSYVFSGEQQSRFEFGNGLSYDFRITAATLKPGTDGTNITDWLVSSDVVVSATLRAATDAPGAVAGLAATPGDTRVHLSWTPPSGDFFGYHIHYTASATVANDAAGAVANDVATAWGVIRVEYPAKPHATLPTLDNGTAYRIRACGR